MEFNISAFTHVGTVRETNQDRILVNGQLLTEGEIHLTEQGNCFCFVADGVGGNKGGDFASHFVLDKIKSEQEKLLIDAEELLKGINKKLIEDTINDAKLKGCCTTLSGLIIQNDFFKIIHSGDSEIWLMRNEMFFKITNDQILDEAIKNSSITSYFGGLDDYLKLDENISIYETLVGDIFLICSDGLFKSLNQKIVKSILKADKDIETKTKKILENCIQAGAEDNTSLILIHQTK